MAEKPQFGEKRLEIFPEYRETCVESGEICRLSQQHHRHLPNR